VNPPTRRGEMDMDDIILRMMQLNNKLLLLLLRVADINGELSTAKGKETMCGLAVEMEDIEQELVRIRKPRRKKDGAKAR
jgi:hypothetical protein